MDMRRTLACLTLPVVLFSLWATPAMGHHVRDYLQPDTTVQGRIYNVVHGDTLILITEGIRLACRLALIDAPEKRQPLHAEAKKALMEKTSGKNLLFDVIHLEMDKNIAIVILRDGERNVNLEMVQDGWAEAYKEYLREPYTDTFLQAEADAKKREAGIWGLTGYMRPSEFRKQVGFREPFIRR